MSSVDVAVIGQGLIGSAAARHLAESGATVALVGPPEVPDRRSSTGPFSSHADEGRITRIAARTMIRAELAARSIARYADIAARAGIGFHTRSGVVVARNDLDDWIDAGLIMGSNIRKVDPDWLFQVTGIEVAGGSPVAYEGGSAGHINPRRLLAAQVSLTEAAGGQVIAGVVDTVRPRAGGYEVAGDWGAVSSQRVLLATGAFSHELAGVKLDLELRPRTTLQVETQVAGLPCLILAPPPDDRLTEIYWVPPVPYPDGRVCLKIGGTLGSAPVIEPDQLSDWFASDGDATEAEALEAVVRSLLPAAQVTSITANPCVVTATPTQNPYIGWVGDGDEIAVAIGGNGSAAKSSDEVGRLAASLFSPDGWTDSLDAGLFVPIAA